MAFGIGSKEFFLAGSTVIIGFFGWLAIKSSMEKIGLNDVQERALASEQIVNDSDQDTLSFEDTKNLNGDNLVATQSANGSTPETCDGVTIGGEYPNLFRAILSSAVGGVWIDGYEFMYNESLTDSVPPKVLVVGSEEFEQITLTTKPGACVSRLP